MPRHAGQEIAENAPLLGRATEDFPDGFVVEHFTRRKNKILH